MEGRDRRRHLNQLKRLGASCDWSRERFTMDEGLSKAVLKVFVELYRKGLIYKDKRLVNWDPKLHTAISDLEVEQIETKGSLWHIKYPLEGLKTNTLSSRPPGPKRCSATPPWRCIRTMSATPPDRQDAILPLVGRRIPIVADEYSDPEKGTGAVKITPAHDFNDFEVGRRQACRGQCSRTSEALNLQENAAFLRPGANARPTATLALHGHDRFAARKKIVGASRARALDKVEPHAHGAARRPLGSADRALPHRPVVRRRQGPARRSPAVREGAPSSCRAQGEDLFDWMENIQPWCISRQLWWGHQIPAWYGPADKIFVAETEDEALGEAHAYYSSRTC